MASISALPKSNRSAIDDHVVSGLTKRIEDGYTFENVITLTTANGGGTSYGLFTTGAKYVAVGQREITTNGDEMIYQPFKNPTVSANGSDISSSTVNINGNNTKASTVSIFQGSTVTADGTPIPRTYMPGSQNAGNRAEGSFREEGFTRILVPNTTYALKITNNGAKTSATTDVHLVWVESDATNVTWR